MYLRTDPPLQSWSPEGQIRGYALMVHGLNNRPSAMQAVVKELVATGIHVTLVILTGHGNVAYGNTLPEGGFRDNGKTSGLAMALAAAAMIDPAGRITASIPLGRPGFFQTAAVHCKIAGR